MDIMKKLVRTQLRQIQRQIDIKQAEIDELREREEKCRRELIGTAETV